MNTNDTTIQFESAYWNDMGDGPLFGNYFQSTGAGSRHNFNLSNASADLQDKINNGFDGWNFGLGTTNTAQPNIVMKQWIYATQNNPVAERYPILNVVYHTPVAPQWDSNKTNPITPIANTSGLNINFTINITDINRDMGKGNVILTINNTNITATNQSATNVTSPIVYLAIVNLTHLPEIGQYNYSWFMNDSLNQVNQTNYSHPFSIYELVLNNAPRIDNISEIPPSPQTFNSNINFTLNITANITDAETSIFKAILSFNGTNFTMQQNGIVFNATINHTFFPTAGNYSYYIFANDTGGLINQTDDFIYILNQQPSTDDTWQDAILLGLVGLSGLIIYISKDMDDEFKPLKLLLYGTSGLLMLIGVYSSVLIANLNNANVGSMIRTFYNITAIAFGFLFAVVTILISKRGIELLNKPQW